MLSLSPHLSLYLSFSLSLSPCLSHHLSLSISLSIYIYIYIYIYILYPNVVICNRNWFIKQGRIFLPPSVCRSRFNAASFLLYSPVIKRKKCKRQEVKGWLHKSKVKVFHFSKWRSVSRKFRKICYTPQINKRVNEKIQSGCLYTI